MNTRERFSRTKRCVLMVALVCLLTAGCASYPNRFEAKTLSRSQLADVVAHNYFGWAYAGSDIDYHYFIRWRYGDSVIPLPKRVWYAAYKLPKPQMAVSHEMALTPDVARWRGCFRRDRAGVFHYTIDAPP